MKMSKRERGLIVLLLISISVYIAIEFLPYFSFGRSSANKDKHKHNDIYAVYGEMVQNIKMKEYYEKTRQKLQDEISKSNILTDIKQEEIIEVLYKSLLSSGIEITNINFTDVLQVEPTDLVDINKSVGVDSNEFSSDSESLPVVYMNVSIDFKSSFQNTLTLIDRLQEDRVDMAITNIHIIKYDNNNVYGVMDISFYAIHMKY